MSGNFAPFADKMRGAALPDIAISTFEHYYNALGSGDTGMISEADIEPVAELPSLADLGKYPEPTPEIWDRAVVVKLNGGLGTSMGMTAAKSLLTVKDGLSFLDIIARQVLRLRQDHGARLPLVLMDSFRTSDDTLAALAPYRDLPTGDMPLDFLQNKVPKVAVDDLSPATWPTDPELEWAPPGHGDIYTALVTSGILDRLLKDGYKYAFVSNADNLGAVIDASILAWFAAEQIPFLMEVADRTEADRKGGHLARRRSDGQLILREVAQTPDADIDEFQNIEKHRYFNTNTLWLNLVKVKAALDARNGVLGLPMIRNKKTVDPSDKSSTPVYQLETAMGAAIAVFEGARALRVPRSRLVPVKTTNDLLALRSDAYVVDSNNHVVMAPERAGTPIFVDLDSDYYKLLADMEARFAAGPPSLVECSRFVVHGDVRFGAGVRAHGDVEVDAVLTGGEIPPGTQLGS